MSAAPTAGEIAKAQTAEATRLGTATLAQISMGQLPTQKIGKPKVSKLVEKKRKPTIQDYKGLAMNSRVLADTDFWYLTEEFADEMELTLKLVQLQNKIDTIPSARRKYFQQYVAALSAAGQQATVQAALAYLRMTDDGYSHTNSLANALSTGDSALKANTARIHNHFSAAGIEIDNMLAEFEQAVILQRNATRSDSQFNSVMEKGQIRDLF